MLQFRTAPSDPRFYSADRDFAHCMDSIVAGVASNMLKKPWPAMATCREQLGVSDAEIGEAVVTFGEVIRNSTNDDVKSLKQALETHGFLALRSEVQIIFLAYLGCAVAGLSWAGRRNATLVDRGPAVDFNWIKQVCEDTREALAKNGANNADARLDEEVPAVQPGPGA